MSLVRGPEAGAPAQALVCKRWIVGICPEAMLASVEGNGCHVEDQGLLRPSSQKGTAVLASTQNFALCMHRDFEGVQRDNEKAVSEMKALTEGFEKEVTEEGELEPSARCAYPGSLPGSTLACKLLLA